MHIYEVNWHLAIILIYNTCLSINIVLFRHQSDISTKLWHPIYHLQVKIARFLIILHFPILNHLPLQGVSKLCKLTKIIDQLLSMNHLILNLTFMTVKEPWHKF